MAPARWTTLGTDGSPAALRAQSASVGVARETWFLDDRFCWSVAADLRTTWLESTVGNGPQMTNHLPQREVTLACGVRF